mmetsp:Transcript_1547/g.2630  ORF Transcript_1547/g.2630 Transcript_1547/m.2630 type:complete len:83 (+) Transcript_1547:332-580(+)
MASPLKFNHSLRMLCLSNNSIGDLGAMAFSQALINNQHIKELLMLFDNEIGDEGAARLAKTLESNLPINNLYLYLEIRSALM